MDKACTAAARTARLLAQRCAPNPGTQIGELIKNLPEALRERRHYGRPLSPPNQDNHPHILDIPRQSLVRRVCIQPAQAIAMGADTPRKKMPPSTLGERQHFY